MRSRVSTGVVLVTLVAVLGLFGSNGLAEAGASPGPGKKPPGTPTARRFGGIPTVGALFAPGSPLHTCTASVVDSAAGNLLITAAHCISGTGDGYVFVPDYHDGVAPFGSWTVTSAFGAQRWLIGQVPQRDFAFLVVAPHERDGHAEQIQDVTGANRLAAAPAPGEQVTVPAYAAGRDDDPITCTTHVYQYAGFPAFNRSGHGWVVVGVIGGLYQGGCYSWTSYSAPFGRSTLRTAARAASGTEPSTFPPPGANGCSGTT
jgi:hypothetical protein